MASNSGIKPISKREFTYHPGGRPFVWIEAKQLPKLRASFKDSHHTSTALAVYLSLAELANEARSREFTATECAISERAGLSKAPVHRRLQDLEAKGFISITRTAFCGPSKYYITPLDQIDTTLDQSDLAVTQSDTTLDQSDTTRYINLSHPIYKEDRKKGDQPKKLTTPDRIGLEKAVNILEAQIKTLEDETYYADDRKEHPEKVIELATKRKQLATAKERLVQGALA
jgi:hypothetical protein